MSRHLSRIGGSRAATGIRVDWLVNSSTRLPGLARGGTRGPEAVRDEDFAENPEPRCPCLLLLDVSGSMAGEPITGAERGAQGVPRRARGRRAGRQAGRGGVRDVRPGDVTTEFESAGVFQPPWLQVGGDTPMGEAIVKGLDLVRERKHAYRENGIAFYRPWIFLITDGAPTDEWADAAAKVKDGEASKSLRLLRRGRRGREHGDPPADRRARAAAPAGPQVPEPLPVALELDEERLALDAGRRRAAPEPEGGARGVGGDLSRAPRRLADGGRVGGRYVPRRRGPALRGRLGVRESWRCPGADRSCSRWSRTGRASSECGAEGARLACDAVADLAAEWAGHGAGLDALHPRHRPRVGRARPRPGRRGGRRTRGEPRDYSGTLLVALVDEASAVFLQVGDGAIVYRGGRLPLHPRPLAPERGVREHDLVRDGRGGRGPRPARPRRAVSTRWLSSPTACSRSRSVSRAARRTGRSSSRCSGASAARAEGGRRRGARGVPRLGARQRADGRRQDARPGDAARGRRRSRRAHSLRPAGEGGRARAVPRPRRRGGRLRRAPPAAARGEDLRSPPRRGPRREDRRDDRDRRDGAPSTRWPGRWASSSSPGADPSSASSCRGSTATARCTPSTARAPAG